MIAVSAAKTLAWNSLRGWLIRNGYARAGDFLQAGPSGNISIDMSKLPPRETDAELAARAQAMLILAIKNMRAEVARAVREQGE